VSGLIPAPTGYPIKLVRDRTPDVLNASGKPGDLWYGDCPPERVGYFLRLKLAEEVGEFLVGGEANELADVLAVVYALANHEGWPIEQIEHKHPRGGFAHAVMMFGRHDEFDRAVVRDHQESA
jgi:predicted house-cleaning noncanonical NTP pyrophosphatase (MazG superfamily)